jgi:uncharacterized membrane protein HdeD (DUF308 family)
MFIVVYGIIKAMSDNSVKKQLINKGITEENAKLLFPEHKKTSSKFSSMKWGIVLIGIGFALLIAMFIAQHLEDDYRMGVTLGLMILFAGIGLIIYYFNLKDRMENGGNNPELR